MTRTSKQDGVGSGGARLRDLRRRVGSREAGLTLTSHIALSSGREEMTWTEGTSAGGMRRAEQVSATMVTGGGREGGRGGGREREGERERGRERGREGKREGGRDRERGGTESFAASSGLRRFEGDA